MDQPGQTSAGGFPQSAGARETTDTKPQYTQIWMSFTIQGLLEARVIIVWYTSRGVKGNYNKKSTTAF